MSRMMWWPALAVYAVVALGLWAAAGVVDWVADRAGRIR